MYVEAGTVNITNTVVASYSVGLQRAGGTLNENYNLFAGVATPYNGTVVSGGNSITGTAAFADAVLYRLSEASTAIDNGTNVGVMSDFEGEARPLGPGFDIGWDEYSGLFMPISGLAATNSSPTPVGDTNTFTATISAGTGVAYQWNFGDGQLGSGPGTAHTYAAAGNYTALVTATNPVNTVTATTLVTITNLAPVADAGVEQTVPVSTLVTLNGSASTDPDNHLPLTYGWTQTGGPAVLLSETAVSSPTFIAPASPTTLTFTLVVTDAAGLVDASPDTISVTVSDVPISGLSGANSSPTRLSESTLFTATISAGTNVTYEWSFDDGKLGNGAVTTNTYAAVGTYYVIVTATNSLGSVSASTQVAITHFEFKVYLPLLLRSFPTSTMSPLPIVARHNSR